MNFIKIAWRDITNILKNRLIRAFVVAIIVIPMLYSMLYLAAFWDPYGKMENLPVAFVNLDKGTMDGNKNVNYGKQFVDKLKKNHEVQWHFVSFDKADKGINGKKYYAEFIVPKDFSERLIKAKTSKPNPPTILFRANEKKNFLAGQITGRSLVDGLKAVVVKSLVDKTTKITFDSLFEVKDALKKASDGSKKIADGVEKANDKVKEAKTKLDDNQDIVDLVTRENFDLLKKTIGDAQSLKNADTSMLKSVPEMLTPNNISIMKKTSKDLKDANIGELLNNPIVKKLPQLATKQNLKNVNTLMKDTDTLSKVNMKKMQPLMNLMKNENKIMSVVSDAKKLSSSIDKKKISPLMNVMQNKSQLLGLVDDANNLSSKFDVTKVSPLLGLMQNSDKILGLMNDADALNNLSSAKELQPIMNIAANKDKFTPLLQDTMKLSSIDVSGMKTMLETQAKGSKAYLDATSFLPQNKDALKASIMTNATLTLDQKKQLVTVIEASNSMRDGLTSTSKAVSSLSDNLATLSAAQTDMKAVMPLMSGVPESIQYINTTVLPQVSKLQTELKDTKALMTGVPESISYVKGLTPQLLSMYGKLQNVKPLMNGVPESLKYVDGLVPQAVGLYGKVEGLKPLANGVPESLNYVKSLVPKLMSMKADLDKNQSNLKTVKELLAKANDPKTKEALEKIKKLENDIKDAKPLLNKLQEQMTDENIDKLSEAPALVNKLVSMQTELKDNEKLLEVTQNALTDENYDQARKLIDAIPTLTADVQKLRDGTKQLNDGLSDGYKKLDKNLINSSDTMAKFVSDPVKLKNKAINPVPNYGTGFAPYFIPLSLWVGAVFMFFVLSVSVDDDINAGPVGTVAGKFVSFGYIGLFQAISVATVVLMLGLKVTSLPLYYLFIIFLSYTFIAITQCFVFLFGDQAGKGAAIVMLILQLTSCGGTFPLEIIPKFFRVLNPYMPFTYGTSGLREVISATSINYGIVAKDFGVLALMLCGSLAISMLLKNHADALKARIEARQEM